jgi:zinc protease
MNAKNVLQCLGAVCVVLVSQWAAAGPKIEHWVAPSGARVYLVENHALPMLDIQIDFAAGGARDPESKTGLASLTSAMLDMGAGGMDENRIASRLADVGARISGGVDKERASISLRTLSTPDARETALDIFRAVLATPEFPAEVLAREKARRAAALRESLTRPDVIAGRALWSAMYPQHSYGRSSTPASIEAIHRDDLEAFYRDHYRAGDAVVTIVGDIGRPEAELVALRLTAGLPGGLAPSAAEALHSQAAGELRLPHPAAQAHVLIGMPALKRGDPDFFALQVGNYTLGGGGFVSRLVREVREKRGFAYSVYSQFAPMAQPGPFLIGLQTRKEQAGEALTVVRDVLVAFLAEGPSEAELQAARQNLAGSFPLRLDSNRKILDNVAAIARYGLPLDYLDRYVENIERVTAADVRAAFARHVRLDDLVTVVVGGE